MIFSIRRFLLFNLLLTITIISSIVAVGNFLLNNLEIQRQSDRQLQQTAYFMEALLTHTAVTPNALKQLQTSIEQYDKKLLKNHDTDFNQLQFQVWNNQGKLIIHSTQIPQSQLATENGYHTIQINNDTWRVYSLRHPSLPVRINVAEPYYFRQDLVKNLMWDNLLIILLSYPLFALLIWITVTRGLKGLRELAKKLSKRKETDFTQITLQDTSIEVATLVKELNQLLERLHYVFERNKRFASDAAHELRTPLAALRTQAQLAVLADTDRERKTVLNNLLRSVDRATHVVQQLLILSRLEAGSVLHGLKKVDLNKIAMEVTAQLAPDAVKKDIDIELIKSHAPAHIEGNETMLNILIRNLVDNAIRYTPEKGSVKVQLISHLPHNIVLRVTDTGPGIPAELRTRVFERFFRVLGTQTAGSGLGLAIVQQIAALHRAKIKLDAPEHGEGLIIEIIFSPHQDSAI